MQQTGVFNRQRHLIDDGFDERDLIIGPAALVRFAQAQHANHLPTQLNGADQDGRCGWGLISRGLDEDGPLFYGFLNGLAYLFLDHWRHRPNVRAGAFIPG